MTKEQKMDNFKIKEFTVTYGRKVSKNYQTGDIILSETIVVPEDCTKDEIEEAKELFTNELMDLVDDKIIEVKL